MKKEHTLFASALVLFMILGSMNFFIGLHMNLYHTTWWFDVFMHILGGFAIGISVIWLCVIKKVSDKELIFATLIGTFLVGIAWEGFEYTIRVIGTMSDTLSDIVFDMIGASIALIVSKKTRI